MRHEISNYMKRIGVSEKDDIEHTYEFLKWLQYCHVTAVPYENLDMISGVSISLEIKDVYHKVVEQQRGGCCFELNCLFAWLLKEMGFEVKSYLARYLRNETGVPVRRHQILLVTCDDGEYICDVGVGQQSPRYPLKFVHGIVQTQFGEKYKFERDNELGWILFDYHKGEWKRFYSFTQEEQYDIDFIQPLFYCEKHPDSAFNKVMVVAVKTKGGRKTLHDRTYKEFVADKLICLEQHLEQERMIEILQQEFFLYGREVIGVIEEAFK